MSTPIKEIIISLGLGSESLFLDLGAGSGEEIAECLENGICVHSFEPNPFLFKRLKNLYNETPNLTLHHAAAWNKNGNRKLFAKNSFNEINGGCTLFGTKTNVSKKKFVRVETIDIGEYILGLGRDVDLLKIDVEAAEYVIIERVIESGAIEKVKNIYCEDHSRKMSDKSWRKHRIEVLDLCNRIGVKINQW